MKQILHLILLLSYLLIISTTVCYSQTYVELQTKKNNIKILKNDANGFAFESSLDKFSITEINVLGQSYAKLLASGYFPDNTIGFPEIPVMVKLIEIPCNSDTDIRIINFDEQIVDMEEYGINNPLYPNQESLRKDINPQNTEFQKKSEIYTDKEFYSPELIRIEKLGKLRGVQIAQLIISPFSYDIETNTLYIKNNIEVEILFKNSNTKNSLKAEKYSPAFEPIYKKLWNYRQSNTKDELSQYPIKYVIISDRMFEETLQPFIEWKTKKGFNVVTAYTDEIGTTTASIKSYMQNLYDAGTTNDPAPSYLLIVGDVAQVATTQITDINRHPSDMYYCEFDGENDYIPEMYFGRFSAQTIEELQILIDKTLMFEKYSFPSTAFLANSLLVSGADEYYSTNYSNGQMNYASQYYLNESHNVDATVFLYPESRNKLNEIIETINNGVAYVNYSAHCIANGWQNPNFNITQLPNLENENEYFFGIGNCCLSNKFDNPECFGEAILRADKKGAVAYIGASNNTYWNEDYYWSVGFSDYFTPNPAYEDTEHGFYDCLFHENGEEPYITAGQIIYAGNMSVMSSTSSLKKYYWEIYHVMGDPSLMPYIGIPEPVQATYDVAIPLGATFFDITVEPEAYVAISKNGILINAIFTNDSGTVSFQIDELGLDLETVLDVVVTKQFRIPHIGQINIEENNNENDIMLRRINKPVQQMHYTEAIFSPEFEIVNIGNSTLETAIISYVINQNEPIVKNWTGNLQRFDVETIIFDEITLPDGTYEFTANASYPNGNEDENQNNNSITRQITVYSGDVSIEKIISPTNTICNASTITPEIIIKNNDNFTLTSLVCRYECAEFSDEILWQASIQQGETSTIQFDPINIADGNHTINFNISQPNGGTNKNRNTEKSIEFEINNNAHPLKLDFKTDNYGHENSWELLHLDTDEIVYSDGNFINNIITHNIYDWCLEQGCYKFTVFDSQRDGMQGSTIWGTEPGKIKITNLTNNQIILDMLGNLSEFKSSYSINFCLDPNNVICPEDLRLTLKDTILCLNSALPTGGTYSGLMFFDDNCINLEELDEGTYEITYTYNFENGEKLCTFNIIIEEASIDEWKQNKKINIYPNPSNGHINVHSELNNNLTFEIFSIFGQSIIKFNDVSDDANLDVSMLSPGIYLLKIFDTNDTYNIKLEILK
ncbi:C25 family cysteine peptidase [Bacteroidales bacterium OttesenSCG-928-I21]|nr:C25 family cysteine peptidase [Bacteroidales bacterium OttesenSCG-928-I21]